MLSRVVARFTRLNSSTLKRTCPICHPWQYDSRISVPVPAGLSQLGLLLSSVSDFGFPCSGMRVLLRSSHIFSESQCHSEEFVQDGVSGEICKFEDLAATKHEVNEGLCKISNLVSDNAEAQVGLAVPFMRSCSHHVSGSVDEGNSDNDSDDTVESRQLGAFKYDILIRDIKVIMNIVENFDAANAEAKQRLDDCGVQPSPNLVLEVLSRLRNDWSAAFTFFLWAGRQPGYTHSAREYHSMIAILGKMRRFDTAWSLIHEMSGTMPTRAGPSIVTPQTLLILIRKYCAAHEVAKAINAYYALRKFGFTPGIEEFQALLAALCRYKNVEDAEHLLLCNERTFPFETKSFNIILNGWCNVLVVLREAKRFWKSMENREIPQDVVSFGCMISCFSKAGNLNDVLRFFNKMKDQGIEPDRKVYNAVIYALAKKNCKKEATDLVKTMEEKGIAPDAVTYNSLIRPLCKARKTDEARLLFDEMVQRGLSPSIRTFHAFFRTLRTAEEVFETLGLMKQSRCDPQLDTYIMLIRKLCRWKQYDKVYQLWGNICNNGPKPDRSAYIVLIHGLFLNGKLEDAHRYYEEMTAKGFSPEPKTDEMIQSWLSGKESTNISSLCTSGGKHVKNHAKFQNTKSSIASRSYPSYPKPEIRNVTREKGFSFW